MYKNKKYINETLKKVWISNKQKSNGTRDQ